jgi:PncC family amidohydrolase
MSDKLSDQLLANSTAVALADVLIAKRLKVVFAESCTAGLVSATLAHVPGISEHLCGSAVTYRQATKQQWLGIDHHVLADNSAESQIVTELMATQVLSKTPEADYSAAITGHLGPHAPHTKDGVVFVAIGRRIDQQIFLDDSARFQLNSRERVARQLEATVLVFNRLLDSMV